MLDTGLHCTDVDIHLTVDTNTRLTVTDAESRIFPPAPSVKAPNPHRQRLAKQDLQDSVLLHFRQTAITAQ